VDCFCWREIRSKREVDIFAIDETISEYIERGAYTLIVCGAVASGGERRRIDLSLTCPTNLFISLSLYIYYGMKMIICSSASLSST
jgi:hypothetical protein